MVRVNWFCSLKRPDSSALTPNERLQTDLNRSSHPPPSYEYRAPTTTKVFSLSHPCACLPMQANTVTTDSSFVLPLVHDAVPQQAIRLPRKALTEVQAAEGLTLSVKTLRDWRQRGVGPRFCKFGRAVRYMSDDLEAYIRASEVVPTGRGTVQ